MTLSTSCRPSPSASHASKDLYCLDEAIAPTVQFAGNGSAGCVTSTETSGTGLLDAPCTRQGCTTNRISFDAALMPHALTATSRPAHAPAGAIHVPLVPAPALVRSTVAGSPAPADTRI